MILTIINFLFYNIIFLILYHLKKIKLNLLIIFFFLLLSVFFLNGFLFDPGYMPDQDAYLLLIKSVRNLNFYFLEEFHLNLSDRTFLASGLMALVPTLFVNNFFDISLSQKFLYLCTILYLYNKKALNYYTLSLFLFLPSMVLYTGIALKESLLFFLVTLGFYFSYKKKHFLSLLIYLVLFFVKPVIFIFSFGFNILYLILFVYKNDNLSKIIIINLILIPIIVFIFFNFDLINNELNERRFIESYYDGKIDQPKIIDLKNLSSVFYLIFFSFNNFLFNPNLISSTNLFQFIQSIENFFLIIVIIFNFAYCYKISKNLSLFWLCYLIIFIFLIGGTVFNAGTLSRWKIEIITYYLFYINFSCSRIKK